MTSHPITHAVHLIADLHAAEDLSCPATMEAILRDAAQAANVSLLDIRLHHFGERAGVTGVALLAESHISIHTWPENGSVAVDIFVCGPRAKPDAALHLITTRLNARVTKLLKLNRFV